MYIYLYIENSNHKPTPEAMTEQETIATDFNPTGYYTVSNCGGYQIELSECGETARLAIFTDRLLEITEWLEIEMMIDEASGEFESVIDPDGYNVPLSQVIRL